MVTTRGAAKRVESPPSTTSRTSPRKGSPVKRKSSLPVKRNSSSPSDEEDRTRPTRKQLAKTSIAAPGPSTITEEPQGRTSFDSVSEAEPTADASGKSKTNGTRGRLRRKRSFEEVGDDVNGEKTTGSAVKPKRKRSKDGDKAAEADDASVSSSSEGSQRSQTLEDVTSTGDNTLGTEESVVTEGTSVSAASEQQKEAKNELNAPTTTTASTTATETESSSVTNDTALDKDKPEVNGVSSSAADHTTQINGDNSAHPSTSAPVPEATAKIPASSGFGNFSTESPFAKLSALKKSTSPPPQPEEKPQTSSSAFKASGFAAFANATQSPFGAFGKSTNAFGSFASTASSSTGTPARGGAEIPPSPFVSAAAGAPSVFGGARTGGFSFGGALGAGSGFGNLGGAKTLSSFADPTLVGKDVKKQPLQVIGAEPQDPEKEDDEESGSEGDVKSEADPEAQISASLEKEESFHEQKVVSGEEDEQEVWKARGKLYMMGADKVWKERGVGEIKVMAKEVKTKEDETEEDETKDPKAKKPETLGPTESARFIMRVDNTRRLVLNSPITKEIKVEDPSRGPPKGKTAIFLGWVDGQLVTLQLKMRDNSMTTALYQAVLDVQEQLV